MHELELVFIEPHGPRYDAERELRFRVLREPLGMTREQVGFAFEGDALHLVLLDGDGVVGCVLFHPDGAGGGRLFQMAVAPERQGQGLGRRLVTHLEESLRARGIVRVVLHARADAIGFYAALGYAEVGAAYVEIGIPHQNMAKAL